MLRTSRMKLIKYKCVGYIKINLPAFAKSMKRTEEDSL